AAAVLPADATESVRTQVNDTLVAAGGHEDLGEELRRGRLVREASGAAGFPDSGGLRLVSSGEQGARTARAGTSTRSREDKDRARVERQRVEAKAAEARAALRDARDEARAAQLAAERANERVD